MIIHTLLSQFHIMSTPLYDALILIALSLSAQHTAQLVGHSSSSWKQLRCVAKLGLPITNCSDMQIFKNHKIRIEAEDWDCEEWWLHCMSPLQPGLICKNLPQTLSKYFATHCTMGLYPCTKLGIFGSSRTIFSNLDFCCFFQFLDCVLLYKVLFTIVLGNICIIHIPQRSRTR